MSFIHEDFMDNCWSEENPGGYFPRQRGYQSYSGGSLSVPTDRYMQNAAYLRLKNLTVGYTLPLKKNNVIQSLRVYFTGENLWYTSPMKKYPALSSCRSLLPDSTPAADRLIRHSDHQSANS